MDSSTDPCDNFYQFACGGFVNKLVIPDDRSEVSSYTMALDNLLKELHKNLAEEIEINEIKPFKMTKILYKSCINRSE